MTEIVFLVEDDVDGGYIAKALDQSIFTQGDTIDELKEMIRDAVICHFAQSVCPERIRLQFIREEVLAV
jgi:predicted RNase H-like HicB family nuclease